MKKGVLLTILMLTSVVAGAQKREIKGTVMDDETGESMPMVTVQLLKLDSTFVTGAVSDDNGKFVLHAPANGRYIFKVSSIGYLATFKEVHIASNRNVNMGNVVMKSDAVMLKEAKITAQALKVNVKEDTFVYNLSLIHI